MIPETQCAPGDFRELPPVAWTALHARFAHSSHEESPRGGFKESARGDFREMPSTAWATLHSMFHKSPQPEKPQGDFREMPSSAWTALHGRFAKAQEPAHAPSDFRNMPPTAWMALHAKFAKTPEPSIVSADFRAMPCTAWASLHAQFAKNAEPEKAKEDATRTRGNTHDEIWLKGEKYVPMLASSTSGTAGDPTEEEADDVSARAPVEKQSGLKPPGLLTKTAQDKKSAAESQARAAVEAREPLQAKRDVSINKDGAVTYKVKGEATLSGGQHVCLKVEQSARLRAEEARLQAEDKAKTFGTIRNTESWKALRNDGTVDACIEKEVIAKMKNKYDTGLEKSVRAWIEEVTGQKDDEQTFAQYLKDGQVLCSLVNAVRPGMIKKVHTSKMPFKQMENVTFFMKAARELGVIDSSIFASRDLYEERNMDSVVMCIYRFAGVVQVACPEFLGPFLGNAINPNSGKEKKRFERQASE
mmetsp:Transcript_71659/g.130954  ORF Transcript_71659/g.130954 Transcript_71659/m.130954 type:complete len:474 (+) Transcript_71659:47-1468(+)